MIASLMRFGRTGMLYASGLMLSFVIGSPIIGPTVTMIGPNLSIPKKFYTSKTAWESKISMGSG